MNAGKGHGVKGQGHGVSGQGQGHWGQRSNNGLISIKLGGWMQGWVTGSKVKVIFGKVKVHGY